MNMSNKLIAIAEKANQVSELDAQLTTILNGGNTGRKGHYDEFWDSYQNEGGALDYSYAFSNNKFTDENYNPKYDIITNETGNPAYYMFYNAKNITDTKVAIYINVGSMARVFYGCNNLVTIRKLGLREGITSYSGAFGKCYDLENLTIEGVIGQNDFDVKDSTKLSKASITNIINALSTETTGLSVTISKTAKESAFTDDEWSVLEATKPNWTITLA